MPAQPGAQVDHAVLAECVDGFARLCSLRIDPGGRAAIGEIAITRGGVDARGIVPLFLAKPGVVLPLKISDPETKPIFGGLKYGFFFCFVQRRPANGMESQCNFEEQSQF